MTPSQIEQYRPGFEAWWRRRFPCRSMGCDRTVAAFEAWIASKADRQVVTEERNRIADALDFEASVCPCEEDAAVIRSCANLVRADFSYEQAEANEAAALNPVIAPVDGMEGGK